MRKHLLPIVLVTIAMVFSCGFFVCNADDGDYIEIRTVDDLYNIRNDLTANYILMNDIDMSETSVSGSLYNNYGNGWDPIGSNGKYECQSFSGIFDGNGHIIKNLTIDLRKAKMPSNTPYSVYAGLFAGNSGTIKNLRVQDSDLYAEREGVGSSDSSSRRANKVHLAPIVAYNTGLIENCSSSTNCTAKAPGSYTIRGTYGASDSTYGLGTVYVGGICAENAGRISCCYNESVLSGSTYSSSGLHCCGIASGSNKNGIIENCYNTSETLINSIGEGAINNCYTITQKVIGGTATNCYYLDGIGTAQTGCIGLNESFAVKKTSYNGFDFDNVWTIETATDYKYPQLRNNMMDAAKHVDVIEWKTEPSKIEYYTDEDIDPSGGVFTAYYIDDTHENIKVTKDMLSGYDMTQLGMQTVTVTFREGTLTYDILTSTRPEVKSLTLESMPDKTEFARGTEFDFTGATAKVEYVNGKTDTIPITAKETTGGNINQSGTYTITFEKYGKTISFEVKVVPVKPTGLVIASLPDKTSYIEGQQVDTTGLVVKLEYNNGKKETITDYTIGDYETTVGSRSVSVTYEDFSTSFQVEFAEKTLTGIMVTTQPTRAKYVVGEEFDPAGMVVKAAYDNGYSEEITDYDVSSLTDATGWQTLTVSYNGKNTTIKVMVEAKELVSISISQMPLKTTYIEGEAFDPEGLVVMGNYNDVLQEEVSDYSLTGTTLNKVGQKSITVLCEGCTATFDVTVVAKTLTKITVTPPKKTDYIAGEEFDDTGMVVKAVYDNGKSETVTDYTLSGFGDDEEANTVLVKYGGKSAGFIVTIHTPEQDWVITTKPTCTGKGEKTLYCANCQKVLDTKEIEAEGHKWGSWTEVSSPNCTDKGSEKHTCSVCDLTEYRDVDPKGHTWENDYTVDSQPSCAQEGSESIHCSVCHISDPDSVRSIEKTPHDYGGWTITKDPTCAEKGVKSKTCKNCNHVDTEDIPATGDHSYGAWHTAKDATCVEPGIKERKCEVCQHVDETSIPATGEHIYGEWEQTKAPTQTATGTKTRTCTICGDKQTETIEMLPKLELSKSSFVWNNKVQTPGVSVKAGDKVLPASCYTVTYPKGRKNVGTYTIKVKLKNGYSGTRSASYTIVPKGAGLTGATAASKAVTVKWAKQAAKMSSVRITGYQIQYSLNKDFKSGNKAVNVGGYTKASRKITGLASKKTYYFRVRTYLKSGSKTYYSGWSKVRASKVK